MKFEGENIRYKQSSHQIAYYVANDGMIAAAKGFSEPGSSQL